MHRLILNLLTIFALFALAACGGGGGGEINPNPPPGPVISLSDLADGAAVVGPAADTGQVLGDGPAAGLTTPNTATGVNGFSYSSDFGVFGSYGSGTVSISVDGGNMKAVDSLSGAIELTPADFTVFDNGLAGKVLMDDSAPLTPENTGIDGASGEVRETQAVMLGGQAVALEYSNFGFWEDRIMVRGEAPGLSIDTAISGVYEAFILESAAASKLPPAAGTAFSGVVLANAYDRADDLNSKSVSLVGEASLEVSTPTEGSLTFSFDNFYTVSSSVDISGGPSAGYLTGLNLTASDPQKNTTGISLTGGSGSVTGQFYGGAGDTTASEAVGRFELNNPATSSGIRGAFGLKQD